MTLKIQIVCGPTASGKSARAIEIAQEQDGVIINADAMQVYSELRILTARPTPEDETKAPHRLYGILSAREACSAGRWLALAQEVIDKTRAEGKLPIVTGGTGLYLKALMEGLSPIPNTAPEARIKATQLWEERKEEALHEYDPNMAMQLKAGDMQRHIRALEVWLTTGKSLLYWQSLPRQKAYPEASFDVELLEVPRSELYRRCDARLLAMVQAGAIEEVKKFQQLNIPTDRPAMRAVGVAEFMGYLKGDYPIEEAIKHAQQATRNYAKRQLTWFTHQLGGTLPDTKN